MSGTNASSIDIEDILSDSLELMGGDPVGEEEGIVRYGPLALTVSPKVLLIAGLGKHKK